MSSARFVGTIRGSNFDAGVALVGDEQAEAPREAQLRDAYYDDLYELTSSGDPALRQQAVNLMAERLAFNQRLKKFFAEQTARAQAILKEKHEAAKARVRDIRAKIEAVKNQMFQLRNEAEQCKAKTDGAFAALRDAQQSRAALGRYAPQADIKKADAAIVKAQEKVNEIQHLEAVPAQAHNQLALVKMHELSEELREAEAEELDLELALTGRRGTNSLGFQV